MPRYEYYIAQNLNTPWDEDHDDRADLPYKCSHCVWAHLIGGGRVVCMFRECTVIKVGDVYYGRTGMTERMKERTYGRRKDEDNGAGETGVL